MIFKNKYKNFIIYFEMNHRKLFNKNFYFNFI